LCLSLFPWGKFRRRKSAVKLHTLLDLRGSIPTNVYVTGGQVHRVNILDQLLPEAGALYLLDRGYVDFARLYVLAQACAFFVTRAKKSMQFYRRNSRPVKRSAGLRSDQTILLTGVRTAQRYPDPLRRIHYCDAERDSRLTFLTNNFLLPALTITQLYRARWKVELFFRWIKQHLHIKAFYGTSEDAVKTQAWVALSVYVLVAIVKKQLGLRPEPVQNSADSQRHSFRKNPNPILSQPLTVWGSVPLVRQDFEGFTGSCQRQSPALSVDGQKL
jgi:Transposase DDE domain